MAQVSVDMKPPLVKVRDAAMIATDPALPGPFVLEVIDEPPDRESASLTLSAISPAFPAFVQPVMAQVSVEMKAPLVKLRDPVLMVTDPAFPAAVQWLRSQASEVIWAE